MSGQPQVATFWTFDINNVEAVEVAGTSPSIVVNAGNNFNLKVTLTLDGLGAAAGVAPWFDPVGPVEGAKIEHFALNLETGIVTTLPYKIPAGQPSLVKDVLYPVTTGPYTTGAGMDLDLGTYLITTHIRLTTPALDDVEAAFFTSNLMVITA